MHDISRTHQLALYRGNSKVYIGKILSKVLLKSEACTPSTLVEGGRVKVGANLSR